MAVGVSALGQEGVSEAERLAMRGVALMEQGRLAEARETLTAAAKQLPESGLRPMETALILIRLGWVHKQLGEAAEAERRLRRAVDLMEGAGGTASPMLARTLNLLGNLYNEYGQAARAERIFRRSVALVRKEEQADADDEGRALNGLGVALLVQRRKEEGEEMLQEALTAWERAPGDTSARTSAAVCRMNLASSRSGRGRHEEALRGAEEALRQLEGARGRQNGEFAIARMNQGMILARAGRMAEGEAALAEAGAIAETALMHQPAMRAWISEHYAEVLRADGAKE